MDKVRTRNWIAYLLCAVIVALGVWGIVQNSQKKRYQNYIDGIYERSFYQLVQNMENLSVKLEKLLIAEESQAGSKLIADIWRQSYSVSESLSQIPAGIGATEETMAFVNKLGEYCMSLTYQDSLSREDRDNLTAMLRVCRALSEDIEAMRLTAAEGIYTLSQPLTKDGELLMDGINLAGIDYPSLIYDGPFSDSATGTPKALPNTEVSADEAIAIAKEFVGSERVRSIEPDGEEAGEIPTWNFTVVLTSNIIVKTAITKQGGLALWMLPESVPKTARLQVDEALIYCEHFMESKGFESLEMVHWQVNGSMALFVFVDVAYDMLIYPDMIKVQVSLETGEVLAYEAGNYIRSHHMRPFPDMLVSEEEALEAAGELENKQLRLCLIPVYSTEIYCYEVKGEFEGGVFYVYVDTLTREIVNVLKLVTTTDGSLTV